MAGAFLFVASPLQAAGTTSAAFLQLGAGARAAGMGDAFTAVADDASATHWNPAGLSLLAKKELLAEHSVHIQGISIDRVAFAHPLSGGRALGASASYLRLDGIEARTGNTALPEGYFGASDAVAALSYAHPLSRRPGRRSGFGVTAKMVRQEIDRHRATAFAADAGLFQQVGRFQAGLVLANVGSGVRFIDESYPLPRTARLGVAYQPRRLPVTLAFGMDRTLGDRGFAYRFGSEYSAGGLLAFRLGYMARPGSTNRALKGSALGAVTEGELAKFTGLVGGMGFRLYNYAVDYAFTPYGELGNTHKVSLSARF